MDLLKDLRGRNGLLSLALFLLGALAATLAFDPQLSRSGDNAEFIILGRALAMGKGYNFINSVELAPATKFPPLFPAMLAAMEWLGAGDIFLMKGMVLLLFSLSIPLVYHLVQEDHSRAIALPVAAICIVSPYLLSASHTIMSEIPFLVVSLAVLRIARRGLQDASTLGWVLVLSGAAFYIRTAGIALMVSICLFYGFRRQFRSALTLFAGMVLMILPWVLFVRGQGGGTYTQVLLLADPYDPHSATLGALGALLRVVRNAFAYTSFHLAPLINPFLSEIPDQYSLLDALGHGAVVCCVIVYALMALRRSISLIPLYLLVYAGMLLCWPEVWASIRFLVPVVPLILYAVFVGGAAILNKIPVSATVRRNGAALLVVSVVLLNAGGSVLLARAQRDPSEAWRDYFLAADWIRQNTAPDVIVACRKPHLMFLRSGRRSVRYAFKPPSALIHELYSQGASLLILDGFGEFGSNTRYLYPALEKHGEIFKALYRTPYAEVLAVHPSPSRRYEFLARSHLEKGEIEEAAAALRDLHDLYPENVDVRRRLAELYAQGGRESEMAKSVGNRDSLDVP